MSNAAYQRDYYARNKEQVAARRTHELRIAKGEKICIACGEQMTKLPADLLCGACHAAKTNGGHL